MSQAERKREKMNEEKKTRTSEFASIAKSVTLLLSDEVTKRFTAGNYQRQREGKGGEDLRQSHPTQKETHTKISHGSHMPYGGDPPATQSAFHSMPLLRIRQLRCLPQAHLVHLSKLSNGQEDFVEFLRYRLCGQGFLNHSLQFYEHPRASIQRSSEASYSKDPLKFPILARNLPQSKEQKKKEEGNNPHRILAIISSRDEVSSWESGAKDVGGWQPSHFPDFVTNKTGKMDCSQLDESPSITMACVLQRRREEEGRSQGKIRKEGRRKSYGKF